MYETQIVSNESTQVDW